MGLKGNKLSTVKIWIPPNGLKIELGMLSTIMRKMVTPFGRSDTSEWSYLASGVWIALSIGRTESYQSSQTGRCIALIEVEILLKNRHYPPPADTRHTCPGAFIYLFIYLSLAARRMGRQRKGLVFRMYRCRRSARIFFSTGGIRGFLVSKNPLLLLIDHRLRLKRFFGVT